MEPDIENFLARQTGKSVALSKLDYWEDSFHKEMLRVDLSCSNDDCQEIGVLIMDGELFAPNEHQPKAEVLFHPIYINPSPNLFQLEPEYPEEIKALMEDAFSLFWSDPASCGNKIRVAVESLLNDQGIDKEQTDRNGIPILSKKGRPKPITLHNRLMAFKKIGSPQQSCVHALESIKWLGNESSHAGLQIHQGIVYKAAMVFGDVLACLYRNVPIPDSVIHEIEHINFWYHPKKQEDWPKK